MTIHQGPALLQNPGGKQVLEAGPVGSTRLLVNYQGKRKNETATLLHSEYVLYILQKVPFDDGTYDICAHC